MVEIKDISGKIVSRSKNLRGIVRYAQNHTVRFAGTILNQKGARVFVEFDNDSLVGVTFADYEVAKQWISRFSTRRGLECHNDDGFIKTFS